MRLRDRLRRLWCRLLGCRTRVLWIDAGGTWAGRPDWPSAGFFVWCSRCRRLERCRCPGCREG